VELVAHLLMEVGQVGAVVITVLKVERVLIHLLLVVVRTAQVLILRHAGKLMVL